MSSHSKPHHHVQFYVDERQQTADAVAYVTRAAREGVGILVVAETGRLDAITRAIAAQGPVLSGQLELVDATEVMHALWKDDAIDRDEFLATIGTRVAKLRAAFPKVRIYGEIVDQWARRNHWQGAIQLEDLWNEFLAAEPVELVCGYAISSFSTGESAADFERICTAHSRVRPSPRYTKLFTTPRQRRVVAILEQQSTALVNEMARQSQESELRCAKEAAEAANRAKTVFLANMSHEIRTPVSTILGFSELVAQAGLPDAKRSEYVSIIRRNGHALVELIDDILDLAKAESGQLRTEARPFAPRSLVEEVKATLEPRAREKGLKIHVTVDPGVPASVVSDPSRLRQILLNLVGNAVKFTKQGEVRIDVRPHAGGTGAGNMAFVISDTGCGITLEAQARLFSLFSQGDPSMTRRFGGAGLGLALSRELTRLLGGDLKLRESRPGGGSTFEATIAAELVQASRSERANPELHDRSDAFPRSLQGMHLLVAEDSPDLQLLAKTILQANGAEVDCVDNGVDAVSAAMQVRYDLVLMDIQMPRMDGLAATRELRRRGADVPIIALTAHAMAEERARCLEAGYDAHITKPISERDISGVVSRYAHRKAWQALPSLPT